MYLYYYDNRYVKISKAKTISESSIFKENSPSAFATVPYTFSPPGTDTLTYSKVFRFCLSFTTPLTVI